MPGLNKNEAAKGAGLGDQLSPMLDWAGLEIDLPQTLEPGEEPNYPAPVDYPWPGATPVPGDEGLKAKRG